MRKFLAAWIALCAVTTGAEANEMFRRNSCRNDLPPELWSAQELAGSLSEILAQEDRCKGSGIYEVILAKAYIGLGRCDDALSAVAAGLAAKPMLVDDLYVIGGQAHACKGDWEPAAQSFARAIEDSPWKFTAHREYAIALYRQQRTPEAIAHLQRTRAGSDNWVINEILALLLYTQNDCPETADAVDRALADRPQLIANQTLVLVGINCNTAIGRIAAADRLVDGLIDANPASAQDPSVQQAIDRLNSRRGG